MPEILIPEPLNPYKSFCLERERAHRLRRLRATKPLPNGRAEQDGRVLLNFSSNDYLGLAHHPALIAKAQDYAARYGTGAAASRLVSGNIPIYDGIESMLALGKGQESALVMGSGYQANLTTLAALADKDVVGRTVTVLADRLCHNSLLQGAKLSGARLIRFRHNDARHLEGLLSKYSNDHIIIVTESVFGMDGDCADLTALTELAERHGAFLYVDEAHATGLFGADGFGFTPAHRGKIDVAMGTFGKALGSFGAYIACDSAIRDYLVQRCGGLIYSTALPPPVLGAISAALEIIPRLDAERAHLQLQARRLRAALREQGWNYGASTTQIIPVILGDELAATALADKLLRQGILVPAIRPPTVPRGTSRLRISLSSAHDVNAIDSLISAMSELARA